MQIASNIKSIQKTIPEDVCLVAVSKTKPISDIEEAYQAGHKIFGENKVQELCEKYEKLPKDIDWHFIGHLQTNKVKYIAPFINLLHGVDSLKILKVINKEAAKNNRTINCLLQVHIAQEESKFGLKESELLSLLNSPDFKVLSNIKIVGLMGMASYTEDENQVRNEFKKLKEIFKNIKQTFFSENMDFKELSMGMSGDYLMAIEEGSTIIRLGSIIFGKRNYLA